MRRNKKIKSIEEEEEEEEIELQEITPPFRQHNSQLPRSLLNFDFTDIPPKLEVPSVQSVKITDFSNITDFQLPPLQSLQLASDIVPTVPDFLLNINLGVSQKTLPGENKENNDKILNIQKGGLPAEIWILVISKYLIATEITNLIQSCKTFRGLVYSDNTTCQYLSDAKNRSFSPYHKSHYLVYQEPLRSYREPIFDQFTYQVPILPNPTHDQNGLEQPGEKGFILKNN